MSCSILAASESRYPGSNRSTRFQASCACRWCSGSGVARRCGVGSLRTWQRSASPPGSRLRATSSWWPQLLLRAARLFIRSGHSSIVPDLESLSCTTGQRFCLGFAGRAGQGECNLDGTRLHESVHFEQLDWLDRRLLRENDACAVLGNALGHRGLRRSSCSALRSSPQSDSLPVSSVIENIAGI